MSISTVTSEALQLKLRQLLPSQQGFGTDLSASDTIIPIIDLTTAAEGSDVPETLQTAIAFGSQTEFSANNSTAVIANTPGFFRIFGAVVVKNATSGTDIASSLIMSDGATTKTVWSCTVPSVSGTLVASENVDITVFLQAGESVSAITNSDNATFIGSSRPTADINGTLIQPVGFTPQ